MVPTTSLIFTWVMLFLSRFSLSAISLRSKGVPQPPLYFPAMLFSLVALIEPNPPTCLSVGVLEVIGNPN